MASKDYIAASVAAERQNGRQPVGNSMSAVQNLSADPGYGKLEPRHSGKPDPLGVTEGVGKRRQTGLLGAQYRVTASLPGPSGEAQLTQANGRLLKPTHSRSDAFYAQEAYR